MLFTRLQHLARRRGLVLLAALALVVSQAIALEHTHDGDLKLRVDCQLCVKLSAGDESIPVSITVLALEHSAPEYIEPIHCAVFTTLPVPTARAPPARSAA